MKLFFLLGFLLSSTGFAGDKIGNGGGLFACFTSTQELQSGNLVDFYEAQNEFGLSLITTTQTDPMALVDQMGISFSQKFPDYATRWAAILSDVKTRIRFVNAELAQVDDSLYRINPLCPNWKYLQFANYTAYPESPNLNQVLIRQDLWQSATVPILDKAGLIWHEVVYRWMREEFGDTNSIRARQIVGILFSTMSVEDARKMLDSILKPSTGDPTPQNPVWVCLVKNDVSFLYYFGYGVNQLLATNQAMDTCQHDNSSIGFHCDSFPNHCDSFTSMKQAYTCSIKNDLTNQNFTETGRSPVEAEAKARRACSDAGQAVHCEQLVSCQ